MIILLEGADCTGKSTLMNSAFGKIPGSHHGAYPTPEAAFQAYEHELNQIGSTLTGFCPIPELCIDRMHISEHIYGQVFHKTWMSDERYDHIENMAKTRHTIVVLCQPPLAAVLTSWQERARLGKELIKDEKTFIDIYLEFDQIYKYTKLPVIRYDYLNLVHNEQSSIRERLEDAYDCFYGG
jgi:hypothetical protein